MLSISDLNIPLIILKPNSNTNTYKPQDEKNIDILNFRPNFGTFNTNDLTVCKSNMSTRHQQRLSSGSGEKTVPSRVSPILNPSCISSSLDWMSGGKSACPQVNGSKGAAPKRSLLMSEGDVVGGGGGVPLLAGIGTRGVTAEKGTMSKTSVDVWGFKEMLPAGGTGAIINCSSRSESCFFSSEFSVSSS